jgi:hypothetical protein
VVWSVDEKTGIQATSRVNPTYPAVPGIPVHHEFEYHRHGERRRPRRSRRE